MRHGDFLTIATAATQNSVIWALFAAPRAEEKHMATIRKHIHVHDNTNNTQRVRLMPVVPASIKRPMCSLHTAPRFQTAVGSRRRRGDDNQRALSHHCENTTRCSRHWRSVEAYRGGLPRSVFWLCDLALDSHHDAMCAQELAHQSTSQTHQHPDGGTQFMLHGENFCKFCAKLRGSFRALSCPLESQQSCSRKSLVRAFFL